MKAIRNQAKADVSLSDLLDFDFDFDAGIEAFDTVSDGELLKLAAELARDCEFDCVLKERLFF